MKRAGILFFVLCALSSYGCASAPLRQAGATPALGSGPLSVKDPPVAEGVVPGPSRDNRGDVDVRDDSATVTLQHPGAARLTPLVRQLEGGIPLVSGDEALEPPSALRALRQKVLARPYDDVQHVLDDTRRADWAEGVKSLEDSTLLELASTPEGLPLLERLFAGLTAGSPDDAALEQAHRLLSAVARLHPVESFVDALRSPHLKRIPYRATGFTVFNSTPLAARWRPDGKIDVVLNTRTSRPEYLDAYRTLRTFHLVLEVDEVVGVTLHDDGGKEIFAPALFLLQLANADDHHAVMKMVESAGLGVGAGLGLPALLGGAVELSALHRTLAWCDLAAVQLGLAVSVLDEHRGWIVSRYGDDGAAFLRQADYVNSAAALYGLGRVVVSVPRLLLGLRTAYQNSLARAAALEGLTAEELKQLQSLRVHMDDFFRQVDKVQASRAGLGAELRATEGQAPAGAKVIPWDGARRTGKAAPPSAVPVSGEAEPLAATGTEGKLIPLRRASTPGDTVTTAGRERGPGSSVEPRVSAPPSSRASAPAGSTASPPPGEGNRPAKASAAAQPKPSLTALPGGLDAGVLSEEEYAARKFFELEKQASRRLPGTLEELAKLRPDQARPPLTVSADDPLWIRYVEYYEGRLAGIAEHERGRVTPRPDNPLPWEQYSVFKRQVARGIELENRVMRAFVAENALPLEQRALLQGIVRAHIERRVGILRDGADQVLYVDQLIVDVENLLQGKAPSVHCFSNKSRVFPNVNDSEAKEIKGIVNRDVQELRAKYEAPFEVRRPGHPLFGKRVDAVQLHLVYDAGLVKPDVRTIIREYMARYHAQVQVHFQ